MRHIVSRSTSLLRVLATPLASTLLLGFCYSASLANDGGIAQGGNPRLLHGHPAVSMESEVIRIKVGKDKITVDCAFVFNNSSRACTARMGFPDIGLGANDPDAENGNSPMKTPPRTTFLSFKSDINGRALPTKLIRADRPGHFWHTKNVTFPAHQKTTVHDVYTQYLGGGLVDAKGGGGSVRHVSYILHTGASWHGNIKRSEILVTFEDALVSDKMQLVPLSKVAKGDDGRGLKSALPAPNAIVWKGCSQPTVQGRTVQFIHTNWKPKLQDDIDLYFGYRSGTP